MQYKKEVLWVAIVTTLILVWGSIPTWVGFSSATPDMHFRGTYFDPQDYAVDLSMMRSGMSGEWAYQFRFTAEPPHPAYVRMFYIVLGHISNWIRLPPETTQELARWLFGFAALFAIYALFRRIFPNLFWTRTAFLLACMGSGIGWIQLIFHWTPGPITPIDFWLIDAYIFFSLSLFPHFAFAIAGMCLATILWLEYLKKPRLQYIIWIALIAILVQLTNPIAFAVVDVGFLTAMLFNWWQNQKVRWGDLPALVTLAIAQTPLFIYNLVVLTRDPLWSQYTFQNQTLSPPPIYYLWGFALLWPFVLIGIVIAFREKRPALGAATFWTVAAFSLAYAPFPIQRRFLLGITIPIALLSAWGLVRLFEAIAARNPGLKQWRLALVMLFVSFASISTIYLSLGRSVYLQTHPAAFFYPAGIDNAAQWLENHAQPNDIALASEQTAQVIAQKTDLRVYFGHEMETLNYAGKQKLVTSFYKGQEPVSWIKSTPIKWVIYGPLEREINPNFLPGQNLALIYNQDDVQIFQVK